MAPHRTSGKLAFDQELRSTLALLLVRRGGSSSSLPLAGVQAVEEQLGGRIPDEIWALCAASGQAPERIRRLTEEAQLRLGLAPGWVAFERSREAGGFYGVDCSEAEGGPVGIWELGPGKRARRSWTSLADFVRWQHQLGDRPAEDQAAFWPRLELPEPAAAGLLGEPAAVRLAPGSPRPRGELR